MTQPDILTIPFGENAAPETINPIPSVRQPSDDPQQATWSEGFPRITMQPLVTGGIPPKGQDFNGVLKALSEHIVFQNKGGIYKWSADIGEYPKGAVLQSDDGQSAYVSLIDGNTDNFNTNPGSIGSSWLPYAGNSFPDGTEAQRGLIRLATTAQAQALTNDATVITPKKLGDAMNTHVLGMGQTWQAVTRVFNTIYTNTTGRAISVSASVDSGPLPAGATMFRIVGLVSGVIVARGGEVRDATSTRDASSFVGISFIVPDGETYQLIPSGGNATNAMLTVMELR